jgi:hypothetical protein
MDDQNIGVTSKSDGLHILGRIGDSLARLHLTANAGKSKVLSLKEAKKHFHFNANARLDETEQFIKDNRPPKVIRRSFLVAWKAACQDEGIGEWGKILKRSYRAAARAESRKLRPRALRDALAQPELTERIVDYIRCTGTPTEHIMFVQKLLTHPEQVYSDVNHTLFESLLRLDASPNDAKVIRGWAVKLLDKWPSITGASACAETAPLLLMRFGDRRSIRRLKTCLARELDKQPSQIVRACAVVYLSYDSQHFGHVRRLAARVQRNHLGDLVKMVEKIQAFDKVPERFLPRLNLRRDAVSGANYLDMRSLLQLRMLKLNTKPQVAQWLRVKKRSLLGDNLSTWDKRLIRKLL